MVYLIKCAFNKTAGIIFLFLLFFFNCDLFSQNYILEKVCKDNKKNKFITLRILTSTKHFFADHYYDTIIVYIDIEKKFKYIKRLNREYIKYDTLLSYKDSNGQYIANNLCQFPLREPIMNFVEFYTGDFDKFKLLLTDYIKTVKNDTSTYSKYVKRIESDTNFTNLNVRANFNKANNFVSYFSSIYLLKDSQVYNVRLLNVDYNEKPEFFKAAKSIQFIQKEDSNKNAIVLRPDLKVGDTLFHQIQTFLTIDSNIIELKNKQIFLFDFWYMSCYPCIKSFPEIEKIINFDSLKNKLQVISVNCKDTKNKALSEFLVTRKVEAPVISSIDYPFLNKFYAYPTFVLTDSHGIILFIYQGYSVDLYSILKNKSLELINLN